MLHDKVTGLKASLDEKDREISDLKHGERRRESVSYFFFFISISYCHESNRRRQLTMTVRTGRILSTTLRVNCKMHKISTKTCRSSSPELKRIKDLAKTGG